MQRHTIVTATLLTITGLTAVVLSETARAQDGASVMIRDDDGGRRVMHMSLPDYGALSTPDFTRRDLPIFVDQLTLSPAQQEAIGRMIDAYLAEFRELTRQLASTAGPQAEYIPEGEERPEGQPRGGIRLGGPGGALPPVDLDGLEKQLPPGSSMSISVGVEDGGPRGDSNEPPPLPSAQVSVSIDAPEGEDIPQEVIDKIKARADEMAAKITDAIMAQREAIEAGGGDDDAAPAAGMVVGNIDDVQARQAELLEKIDEFRKAKAQLRSTFVIEGQASLAEQQAARWPALERALTRERSLPKGRLSGETTDLTKVLDSMKFDESQLESIAPLIESYEISLDAALKQRDAYLLDANKNIDAAIAEQKPDRAIHIANRAADLRVAVRTVNQMGAVEMAQALGGEEGVAFELAALKAFYPSVYQTTRGQKMFASATEIAGLDPATRDALGDLQQAYDADLANVNQQIRGVIDREQPQEGKRSLERLKRTMQGEDGRVEPHDPHASFAAMRMEDPIRQAMAKRGELDEKYLGLVSQLLSPEQAATLPKPRKNRGPLVISSGEG